MTVRELFKRFSQPMQTVTITELIDPSISDTTIYEGYIKDIPSRLQNRIVFGWSGRTAWYGSTNGYDTDIVVTVNEENYSENFKKLRISEEKSRTRKRSIKESYEGSHTFGYIEPDGEFYQDIFGEFTVEEYYDEENDEILGWTWYCSDDFEPTEPYFSTAKEAYEDAKYVLTPDDGSELVIDESRSRTRKRSSCMNERPVYMSESLEDEDTVYKYYLLRRDKGSNSYVIEELYDDSWSLRTVKQDARDYYESDRRHLYGNTPEYWAYDVKLNKAYPPARFTKEDQVFDYTLPIVRP